MILGIALLFYILSILSGFARDIEAQTQLRPD